MNNITLILLSVFLNALAQITMKKGMMSIGEINHNFKDFFILIPSMITNIYIWLTFFCYIFSIFLWMIVLSKVEVSYAYPFLSVGYIILLFAGHFIFNENITITRIAGVIVISIGVILISKS